MATDSRKTWSIVRVCSICGAAIGLLVLVAVALLFESESLEPQNALFGQQLGALTALVMPACTGSTGTPSSASPTSDVTAEMAPLATSPSNASASSIGNGTHPDLEQFGQPRGYAPVRTEKLTEQDIVFENLTTIDLRFFQGMQCKGGNCPQFGSCSAELPKTATRVSACWNTDAVDENEVTTSIPRNYKGANTSFDMQVGEPFAGQVFVLENVYINDRGSVFDRHHLYIHGLFCKSCPLDFGRYSVNETTVHVFREMGSIAYWNGANFYHAVLESMPALLLLAPFLATRPGLPLAYRALQENFFGVFGLIGLPPGALNAHMIHDAELFFVERLLLPAQAQCARPSRALVRQIRKMFLKLPEQPPGAKRVESDFEGETDESAQKEPTVPAGSAARAPAGSAARAPAGSVSVDGATQREAGDGETQETKEQAGIPATWRIVIGEREKTRRPVGWKYLLEKILKLLPANRTQMFTGDLPLEEARVLFSTTRLYIAPHGAALTNMVFMPWYGEVLEFRPLGFNNGVYHYVADVCGLKYNLVHGNGTKETDLEIDHGGVLATIKQIVRGLP